MIAPGRGPSAAGGLSARAGADRRLGLALLTPALGLLAAVTLGPALAVMWLALQRRVPVFDIAEFVGAANFIFLAGDSRFWNAARVTAAFTAASVTLELVLGVAVALALRAQRRGAGLALSLLLLPWALPSVVVARTFEWLYHPTAGLVNVLLGGRAINWLGDPALALTGVVLADVWRTLPFVALLCYARLLSIPPDTLEAAAVDGAGPLGRLRHVILPQLRQVLLIALLFRTLDALRAFDLMFVLTGGGPAGTTETLTVYAYRSLFQTLQLGLGAAIGLVVFGAVMVVAAGYLHLLRREGRAAR